MPTVQFPMRLSRPPQTLADAATFALVTAGLAGDPVFLWFAPLLVPWAIWLQARREWVAAERHIEAAIARWVLGPRDGADATAYPGLRRAISLARRSSRRTLIVNYRKDV